MRNTKIDYTPTSPLTSKPGGRALVIEYTSGKVYTQKNCHYPDKYIKRVIAEARSGPIQRAFWAGRLIYTLDGFC